MQCIDCGYSVIRDGVQVDMLIFGRCLQCHLKHGQTETCECIAPETEREDGTHSRTCFLCKKQL